MNLNHFLVTLGLSFAVSNAAISYEPVTTGATLSAQKLYNFLATNYEIKTISGIQTGDLNVSNNLKAQEDMQAVFNASGKYPALVGFDFLFANGISATNSWNQEYTNTTLTLATELWNAGGIPAFSWHWKDPSDQVDAFYTQGAGDPYTTFDFSKAFKVGTAEFDTSTTTYKQIVADIDEVALLFKTLQDDNVAAIFRPLHECGGTWFWWNTKPAEQYAALYRLVYDRMTNTNNIKNLVWVWNPQTSIFSQAGWNPGASYYDILGVDIYNNAYNYQSNASTFKSMQNEYGVDKILTLSENGPIPDASLMHDENAVWSWYMPWYESWGGKFVSKTKNTVWQANLESPCVYTLDKMPGWNNYTISSAKVASCSVGYALGDLDTTIIVEEINVDTTNANGWLKVSVDNMHNEVNALGDTTVPAAANIYISPKADFSGATTVSVAAYNTSLSGVWISLALLTDADWNWEMAPDGCWINGGDSTTCTFDVSKMSMDRISKLYIMIATDGYSGTIYFDDLLSDKGELASFDVASDLFKREGLGADAYIKTIALVGGAGDGLNSVSSLKNIEPNLNQIKVFANSISINLLQSENISLSVYDTKGRLIAELYHGHLNGGIHSFELKDLENGIHILRFNGESGSFVRSIVNH